MEEYEYWASEEADRQSRIKALRRMIVRRTALALLLLGVLFFALARMGGAS